MFYIIESYHTRLTHAVTWQKNITFAINTSYNIYFLSVIFAEELLYEDLSNTV